MRVSDLLVAELRWLVPPDRVLTDSAVTASFATEWTGRFPGVADLVVMPRSTAEVAAVVAACARAGVPIVPQGGRTGLVGGAMPAEGTVVIDTRRLDRLTVDPAGWYATAGAGVTVAALSAAAGRHGLRYAVDLASRDSATIGGTVATNAGGVRAMRLGDTRAQLLGIEAVLADGSVVATMPGLTRNNTGYHLPSLLCGSEGTLAIITAAQLRLSPVRPSVSVALLGFATTTAAVAAAQQLRVAPFVEAVELMHRAGVDLVCRTAGLPTPLPRPHEWYLLVEAAAPAAVDDGLVAVVEGLELVADVAVGLDRPAMARLWAYRDRHTEAIATLGPAHKLDVTLPAGVLAEFVDGIPVQVAAVYPGASVWRFGHVADGNVHINVTGVDPGDTGVDDLVLRAVHEVGGSISSEHGIGRAKLPWISLVRSAAELRLMSSVKAALDPAGIMNPGVLIPPAA